MHPGPGQLHMMRGFASDSSVTKQQLKQGTVGRIAGYARPYRWELAIFLLAAALDAVITVTIPVRGAAAADRGDGLVSAHARAGRAASELLIQGKAFDREGSRLTTPSRIARCRNAAAGGAGVPKDRERGAR